MTHVLDTSEVLAHYFREAGSAVVQALFDDQDVEIGLLVLTLFEVATAVSHESGDAMFGESVALGYARIVNVVVPVMQETVVQALALRRASTGRIPLVDCLIATAALGHNAKLVHRDPHFGVLPVGQPRQESLPAK